MISLAKLDKTTLVPLGVVVGAFFSLASAYNYLESRFRGVERLLETVDRRLERVEERQKDGWSVSDQLIWAAKLARDNPELKVPGPGGGRD